MRSRDTTPDQRLGALLALLLALVALAAPSAQAQSDWPSFRGGPEMTGVARETLPARPRLLWTYRASGPIEATAAIVGDTVRGHPRR